MKFKSLFFLALCFSFTKAEVAKYFIYPVVGDNENVAGIAGNIYNPCQSHGWRIDGNDFGNNLGYNPLYNPNRDPELPPCGVNYTFHPGEDWNRIDGLDANKPVYSIGSGVVVRRSNLNAARSYGYIIILYELQQSIDLSDYFLSNTVPPDDYKNSKWVGFDYYHVIVNSSLSVGDRVVRGQKLGVIDPVNPAGPHLHFEAMVFTEQQVQQIFDGIESGNISTVATSARNRCGYYLCRQDITDHGYINPTQFIANHVQPTSFSGLTYADSWVCDNWTAGSNPYDKDPVNIRNVFEEGEYVCCLTEFTNVLIDHRFKVEAYCNGQKKWQFIDGWRDVNNLWDYSHFYPFWYGVPIGNNEFRVFIDVNQSNSDDIDDWCNVATKKFTVEEEGIYGAAIGGGIYEPGNLTVSSVSQNSVILNWDLGLNTVPNLTYYIYRSTSNNVNSATEIASTPVNNYVDQDLSSGTTYYYWVKAGIGSELSDYSEMVSATTQYAPPDGSIPTAPEDVIFVFSENGLVKILWSAGANNPNNISDYKLFRGITTNPSEAFYEALTPYTEQIVYSTLNPSTTYYFWVKALNHCNEESGFSAMVTVDMNNYVYPPENLVAVNSGGTINLYWSCQSPESVHFNIYRSTSSGFSGQSLIGWGGTSRVYHDANVDAGGKYYYRISSELNGAKSDYSNIASATADPFPAPDNFCVTKLAPTRVSLAWNKPSADTIFEYWLFRRLNNSQQWGEITRDTFFVDSTVVPGTTYSYRVRARSHTVSEVSPDLVVDVPLKKKVYSDFVFLSDADSNGYCEAAYLYKKGDDSVLVSILDLGNNRILKTLFMGNYSPGYLSAVEVARQPKLYVSLDSMTADTTLIRVVDVGLNRETVVFNAPVNLQSATVSYTQIAINWSKGDNPDSLGVVYRVYANQSNDSSFAQLIGSTFGTSYVHAGLSPGSSWYYWVKSSVGSEVSSLVGPLSVQTNQLPFPDNFESKEVTYYKVVLGWNRVPGVSGYRIYRDGSYLGFTASDSFYDASVVSLTQYSYQVASVCGNFMSWPSDTVSVLTPYHYLFSVVNMGNFKDAEFLPDMDFDNLPEIAALGVGSTNQPMVIIKNIESNEVLAQIPFFSDSAVPLNFSAMYSGDEYPAFTVMAAEADTVKFETRNIYGQKLSQ